MFETAENLLAFGWARVQPSPTIDKREEFVKAIVPYIYFYNHCEEAMTFYQSVLGGELKIMRFSDPMPGNGLVIIACDSQDPPDWTAKFSRCTIKAKLFNPKENL